LEPLPVRYNVTFADLGVTPGTYVWTWDTGEHADSFTLKSGVGVPDSGSTLGPLFFALIALLGAHRLRSLWVA